MSDEPTGQEPTTPPAGQEPAAPAAEPAAEPQAGDDQVKALRSEAAKYRTERNALQKQHDDLAAKLKEFEDAKLSDQERLAKQLEEANSRASTLEQRARDALLRATVTAEAVAAGIKDTDAARLLLPSVGQVEYDADTGEPSNVGDLVKALVEQKPYLVQGDQPADPPRDPRTQRTTPATSKRNAGSFTRAQVEAMSAEEIRRLSPADYQAAMQAIAG